MALFRDSHMDGSLGATADLVQLGRGLMGDHRLRPGTQHGRPQECQARRVTAVGGIGPPVEPLPPAIVQPDTYRGLGQPGVESLAAGQHAMLLIEQFV
jgi:hypothetical protein